MSVEFDAPAKNFLLVGRTGVGKSSFINYALGRDVAEVDPYRACTARVDPHPVPGGRFFDSPGLAEGGTRTDDYYLDMVRERLADVRLDGVLYLTPLGEPRFRPEEKRTLTAITSRLGTGVWRSAWLVLTFAGAVEESRRAEAADRRSADIAGHLRGSTEGAGAGPPFPGFRGVLLVDNVTPGWAAAPRPLPELFGCGGWRAVGESHLPMVRYWESIPAVAT